MALKPVLLSASTTLGRFQFRGTIKCREGLLLGSEAENLEAIVLSLDAALSKVDGDHKQALLWFDKFRGRRAWIQV